MTRLFVDGAQEASATDTKSYSSTANVFVGKSNVFSGRDLEAYIDELRVTNAALYTANCTPPSAPF